MKTGNLSESLINKFGTNGIRVNLDEDYLYELSYGMPPLSGVGIGIDRLIMILRGKNNIDEVIAYPYRG